MKKRGKDNLVRTIYFKYLTQIINGFPILNIPNVLLLCYYTVVAMPFGKQTYSEGQCR